MTATTVFVATPAYAVAPTVASLSPISGPLAGGTVVTITGANLSGATGVTFDGVAATAVSVTDSTHVVATAPVHAAGTAAVEVTVPGVGNGTSANGILFTYAAAPTTTAITPAKGPIAGGQTVIITGTNLTGVTSVTIGGAAATPITLNSATSVTVVTPSHGAGVVLAVVTTTSGQVALNYEYVGVPTVSGLSPTTGGALGGTAVTISGANLLGATDVTFDGVSGTGLSVTSGTSLVVTTPARPAGAGTPAVVVTAPGGVSSGNTFTYTVPANTAPSVTTQPVAKSVSLLSPSATFTAAGSGWPWPTVQWQEKPAGGAWANRAGATSLTLTITAIAADNGKQFRAVFSNTSGVDATSSPATLTIVGDPPSAPAAPVLTAGISQIAATWVAPSTNGTPITGYTVTAVPGPATCTTTTALTCVLGATAGTAYTVKVVAKSAAGDSALSGASNSVTPTAPTIPSTPPTTSDQLVTDEGPINAAEPGQSITLTGSGYAPYATVIITLYSAPVQLGSVTADATGTFTTTVIIPADVTAATHSLVASGIDAAGAARAERMDIYVALGATVRMRGPILRNSDGLSQMFARGADNYLYTSVQAADGTWGAWTFLSGLIYSDPVAVLNGNGRLTVFAIGGDHSVWYRLQNSDGSFAWWTRLGAAKWAEKIETAQNQDGTVAVFVRGPDHNLYQQVQTDAADPTQWSGWTDLSGLIYSEPTAFTRSDGIMEVFAVGGDGQVWHRVQSAPNSTTWAWWAHVSP